MGSWVVESCVPRETKRSKWDLGTRYVPKITNWCVENCWHKNKQATGTKANPSRVTQFKPLSGTLSGSVHWEPALFLVSYNHPCITVHLVGGEIPKEGTQTVTSWMRSGTN